MSPATKDHDLEQFALLRSQLEALRRKSVEERLGLIKDTFPQIYQDAERFVKQTQAVPWDFLVAFVEGEPDAIKQKYDVHSSRHRQYYPDVSEETDMFYQACELVWQGFAAERPEE